MENSIETVDELLEKDAILLIGYLKRFLKTLPHNFWMWNTIY